MLTSPTIEAVRRLPPIGFPEPPPRDPRFVHGPAELCQLASSMEIGAPLPRGKWVLEEKVDGIRMLWLAGEIVTRKGEPLLAAEHLRPELERLERRFGQPMMLDGEFEEPGGFLKTLAAFNKGEGSGRGRFHWFDAMPIDDWRAARFDRPLWWRRANMQNALAEWSPELVRLSPQRGAVDAVDVKRSAEFIWSRGGEGLVLKDAASLYRRGRTRTWLKVKRGLVLECVLLEVLKGGAAAKVLYEGRKLRVAVPPPARGIALQPGRAVTVEAMEWTETGLLRQGRIAGAER